jgi:putative chitinase
MITYDRAKFFAAIRPLFGKLTGTQVTAMEFILTAYEQARPNGFIKFLAYMLATTFHETAKTMLPIEEYGRGRGRKYHASGFWGRGYVQLTWDYNYIKASKRLKELFGIDVDFTKQPDLVMLPEYAILIMIVGMEEGWFTGRKLSHYFTPTSSSPVAARKIINGTDKAALIATYYGAFLKALLASEVKH